MVLSERVVGAVRPSPVLTTPTRKLREHQTLRRLFRIGNAWIGLLLMSSVVIVGLAAPWLAPEGYDVQNIQLRVARPAWLENGSIDYPLGTDTLGRSVLTRIIWAARVSLTVAGFSVLV